MGFRFRKSVRICKGISIGLSTRGASISLGGRGMRTTFGPSGVRTTIGIPGTGLSYSAYSSHGGRPSRGPSQRALKAAEYADWVGQLQHCFDGQHQLQLIDAAGNPVPDWVARKFKKENPAAIQAMHRDYHNRHNHQTDRLLDFHHDFFPPRKADEWELMAARRSFDPEPFWEPAPTRDAILEQVRKEVTGASADASPLLGLLSFASLVGAIGLRDSRPTAVALLLVAVACLVLLTVLRKRHRHRIDDEIARRSRDAFETASNEWRERRDLHEEAETRRSAEFERCEGQRLSSLGLLRQGQVEAMTAELEAALQEVQFPLDTDVNFQVLDSSHVFLDVDLPEIEHLPETKATLLASGKTSIKKKTQRELQEQYALVTHGLALRLGSLAFYVLPTCERVTVSGYTQRVEPPDRSPRDVYVFSIQFDRQAYASLDHGRLDPIAAFERFEHRRKMMKTWQLKEVEPYSVVAASHN